MIFFIHYSGGIKMNSLIVEYDLCNPNSDYDELISAIESFPISEPITKSTWFIKTDKTCKNVIIFLKQFINSDDRLFVAKLSSSAAWINIRGSGERIKKHMQSINE